MDKNKLMKVFGMVGVGLAIGHTIYSIVRTHELLKQEQQLIDITNVEIPEEEIVEE